MEIIYVDDKGNKFRIHKSGDFWDWDVYNPKTEKISTYSKSDYKGASYLKTSRDCIDMIKELYGNNITQITPDGEWFENKTTSRKTSFASYLEMAEEQLFGSDLSNIGLSKEEVKLLQDNGVTKALDLFPGETNLENISDKDIIDKARAKLSEIKKQC